MEYSIYIKTHIECNTSAVNTDLIVTVDNAPTSLDLTTTYTSGKILARLSNVSGFKSTKSRSHIFANVVPESIPCL